MPDQLKRIHIKHASNADRGIVVKRIEEMGGKCTGPLSYEVSHQSSEDDLRAALLEDTKDDPVVEIESS